MATAAAATEAETAAATRAARGRARPAVRITRIVTSFVRDADTGRILLLRRSGRVRTMRGLWSGVSGIIEGKESPLARAKIEILEETGITEDKIRLIRRADAMRIDSPQYKNHEWMIFSFLFESRSPGVRLNWENSDYRWIDAADMKSYDTVPDLDRVLLCLLR